MVGTTKTCLRKVLGLSQTSKEMATTLVNIEAALNSRPITQDDENELTPAHFLCGERLTALPSGIEPQVERKLTKAYQRTQNLADTCKRWEMKYLLDLKKFHEVSQPHKGSGNVRVGHIVLLQQERRPKHMWSKARVVELKVGRWGHEKGHHSWVARKSSGPPNPAGHDSGGRPGWGGCGGSMKMED